MIDLRGKALLPDEREWLESPLVGGVILFTRNFTSDNRRLLRMLQSGRFGVDGLAVLNQDVAWHLIEEERLADVREAGEMGPISYGIGLSRKTVSAAQFEAFEQALDAAIADGTVPKILRRHQLEAAF
jgi:polar amino acid transport system substrate-binding protein